MIAPATFVLEMIARLSVGSGSRLNSGWRTRCQSIWGRGLLPRGAFPHLWRWLAVAAPAAATLGYPWLPWLPLATLLAALGYPWLHLATLAYPWLPFATVGYPWLPSLPWATLVVPWALAITIP